MGLAGAGTGAVLTGGAGAVVTGGAISAGSCCLNDAGRVAANGLNRSFRYTSFGRCAIAKVTLLAPLANSCAAFDISWNPLNTCFKSCRSTASSSASVLSYNLQPALM